MGKIRFNYVMQLVVVVSMVFLSSGCGSSSSSSTPPPADITAPSAPTHLTAVAASSTRVTLRWLASPESDVTKYAVYRDGALLATTTTITTLYSDTTCTAGNTTGNTYIYTVAARDAAGNESAFSLSATTTTIPGGNNDGTAPSVPTGLDVLRSATTSSRISLSWSTSTDNVGVSGYNIYRTAALSGAAFALVSTTTTTSYVDTGLTSGKTYYYEVTAFDGFPNESSPSINIVQETTR